MRLEDCYKKRLLRKGKPDKKKANRGLEVAFVKLNRAYELFENGFYEESIVTTYTSMFHAARSILFNEGVIEKSHACVVAYLSKNHSRTLGKDKISWLDTYRLERHESFYGLTNLDVKEEEAEDALKKCEMFLEVVKNIIEE
jgi:uncharacterized protein (UPF0332 family)